MFLAFYTDIESSRVEQQQQHVEVMSTSSFASPQLFFVLLGEGKVAKMKRETIRGCTEYVSLVNIMKLHSNSRLFW